MKVLHLYQASFPNDMGGIEQCIHQIAKGSSQLGIKTDVLSLASIPATTAIEINGYLVHQAKLNFQLASTRFSTSVFSLFSQLVKQADIVHYHFPWPLMDVVHFITQVKKPTVVTYHSDIIRQQYLLKLYRPLQRRFLASVDHIVATSPNYLTTSEVLQPLSNKVSVIPIGLDKGTYPPPMAHKLQYWREKIGAKFFLFVGVLRYYKGLHILLEAAQGLNYPIVIVGSGPIEQELKKQATGLGLNHVYFQGNLPDEDKIALLSLCYGVLFPSHLRSEAFGISLLEGAMYGKPMISCEIGTGTSFINIANVTGLVIPPSNPIALKQAICYLSENPEIAAKMGQQAEVRYWQNFTADKMVRSYVDLYDKLVNKS